MRSSIHFMPRKLGNVFPMVQALSSLKVFDQAAFPI